MPKFRVNVVYTVVEQVEVEADNMTHAEDMCFALAHEQGQEWKEVKREERRAFRRIVVAAE